MFVCFFIQTFARKSVTSNTDRRVNAHLIVDVGEPHLAARCSFNRVNAYVHSEHAQLKIVDASAIDALLYGCDEHRLLEVNAHKFVVNFPNKRHFREMTL